MPSHDPVPTIAELRKAARDEILGRDPRLSARSGGGYDYTQGPMALLNARQAKRDQELFKRVYVETSRGEDRDRLVEAYYRIERVQRTYGTGKVVLKRSGSGTVYAGTPFEVLVPGQSPVRYSVTEDTAFVDASIAFEVPIRAERPGKGVRVDVSGSSVRFGDGAEYIALFTILSLRCDDGTDEELDDDYLARARSGRREARVGHLRRIIQACKDAGAYHVVALNDGTFRSPYSLANDYGLTFMYVGDASYTTPPGMITTCTLALESVRVCGCDMQVLGMTQSAVDFTVAVKLWEDPGQFDIADVTTAIVTAVSEEFAGRTNWWTFSYDELRGAVLRASDAIQSATVTSAATEPPATFPTPTLTRYVLRQVNVSLAGPT